MHLTSTETAAVLAGLRLLQQSDVLPNGVDDVLTNSGQLPRITETAIDALCERINTPSTPSTAERLLLDLERRFGPGFDNDEDIDGADAVEWIGEFLPRMRRALAAPVAAPRVVVTMEGGCLTDVSADLPGMELVVVDYDVEDYDGDALRPIPQFDHAGDIEGHEDAVVHHQLATHDARRVAHVFDLLGVPAAAADEHGRDVLTDVVQLLGDCSSVITDLADGWVARELHRKPDELLADIATQTLAVQRLSAVPTPECGHSCCRQHWIDTGSTECVREAAEA